jgi:hypothetical protein
MTRQEKRRQSKATARTATIHRTGRYTFEIDSRTRPGHTHKIDALRLECSCEAGKEGMRCWALVLALMVEQGYRAITPKRARTTPTSHAPARPAGAAALLEAFGV